MFEKFEKYWSIVHVIMVVSVILDSRYKMKVVEFYFLTIYCENGIEEIEKVMKSCYDLPQEYQSKSSNDKSSKNVRSLFNSVNFGDVADGEGENMAKLFQFLSSSASTEFVKSELGHYLEVPVLPWIQNFDILNWWKINGVKYPILQLIAQDLLEIPISTIASESAFSTGGRVVIAHRSRLHPNTLEALTCSQSWLWSEIQGESTASEILKVCTTEEDDVD